MNFQKPFAADPVVRRLSFHVSDNLASLCIGVVFILLILNCVFVDRGYFDTMPQDLFGYLDGVYRAYLGQIPHRDFSTPQGPLQFLFPALFMKLGAAPVASVRYYNAAVLLFAIPIVIYLQRTRFNNLVAITLGVLIGATLAAKLMLGDNIFADATIAMFYNRIGYTFLILITALSVPPWKNHNNNLATVDGALMGLLAGLLFYIKITFGLIALALIVLNLFSSRDTKEKLKGLLASAIVFLLIMIAVELVYGVRFAWLRDMQMATASTKRYWTTPFKKLLLSGPEVVGAIVIPVVALGLGGVGSRPYWLLLAALLGAASSVLVLYSAQGPILFLPIAFLLAASALLDRHEAAFSEPTADSRWRSIGLNAWCVALMAALAYPLLYNIVSSSALYALEKPLNKDNPVLASIHTRGPYGNEGTFSISQANQLVPYDLVVAARASKNPFMFDTASFRDFVVYAQEGIRSAKAGCPANSRIATLDAVNAFPVLLGWPEGGGMLFINPLYLTSVKSHLPAEVMYRDIDCILVPKMQLVWGSREFLEDIYGDYLTRNFEQSYESRFWKVLKRDTLIVSRPK